MKNIKTEKNKMLVELFLQGMKLDREYTAALAMRHYDVAENLRYLMDANKKAIERLKEWNTKKLYTASQSLKR